MRRFTIAQLDAFDAICSLGTFSAAAEALHLTQPSISQRIAELESGLGTKVFVRNGKKVELTRDGVLLKSYVKSSIGLLDEISRIFNACEGGAVESIRIGTIDTLAFTCLASVAESLSKQYPQAKIDFVIATNNALLDALDRHEIDIAFLLQPVIRANQWGHEIGKIDIAWISRKGLLSERGPLTPKALANAKILTRPQPSKLHGVIIDWFAKAQVPAPKLQYCSSIGVISKFVERGLVTSVLPVCILSDGIGSGSLVRHDAVPSLLPMGIYAIALRENESRYNELVVPVVQAELLAAGIITHTSAG